MGSARQAGETLKGLGTQNSHVCFRQTTGELGHEELDNLYMTHTCNPSFRKQRQEGQKIKVTLIYTVTSRSIWTTGDPVSKEGNKEWAISMAGGEKHWLF